MPLDDVSQPKSETCTPGDEHVAGEGTLTICYFWDDEPDYDDDWYYEDDPILSLKAREMADYEAYLREQEAAASRDEIGADDKPAGKDTSGGEGDTGKLPDRSGRNS